ncbi:MAG: adhesin, partial [Betaproteobacteria bacterium]|nr:adhesin [Betaproteobacteria bacterium]
MLALSTSVVDVSCNAGASGAIDLTVTGGTAPYTYLWNDPNASTTEDLSSLTAGTYNVTVTDANGCTASTSATVTQPAALVLTTSSTPASCNPN